VCSGVCVLLTGGAVDSVASRLTVLTGGAMETLVATALSVAVVTVLTLPVIGAPIADISGAFEALVAVVTGAAGMILQHTHPNCRYHEQTQRRECLMNVFKPFSQTSFVSI